MAQQTVAVAFTGNYFQLSGIKQGERLYSTERYNAPHDPRIEPAKYGCEPNTQTNLVPSRVVK